MLFQRSTCSHTFECYRHYFKSSPAVISSLKGIVFLWTKFFKGIAVIRNSSCSHPLNKWPFFYNKKATHSFKFTVFAELELWQRDINTNYDTSLFSDMYILKGVCYMMASIPPIHFFYGSVINSREYLKLSICQGHCVYSQHFLQPPIITSGLCLIRENLKDFWWNPL